MKKAILFFLILFISLPAFCTHLIGGEMRYEFIGPGSAPNTKKYKISLLLMRGPSGAAFITQYIVGVFNNDDNSKVLGTAENQNWAARQDFTTPIPVPINISPCISFAPTLNYTYKTYSFTIELPINNAGYTVAFQTFSRQNSNNVIDNSGANYTCIIPGLNQLAANLNDNSPKFSLPIAVICNSAPFTLDFSATDVDNDSLVYSFCNAYDGGDAPQADYRDPAPPPYNSVTYTNPYTAVKPLGANVSIDSHTGIISGTAPPPGKYVICVCIAVFRNGNFISTHRKDLIVEVSGCIRTQAIPDPGFTTCDGFNIQFNHNSSGANTVYWDFGDLSLDSDTSHLDNPVFVYGDTGIYKVKFVINRGESCSDSTTITMGIYPGFFPGLDVVSPYCVGTPITFKDTSSTRYGNINSWSWNFGDGTTLADTSHLQSPQYTFTNAGTYNTRFIVTSDKGCIDTLFKPIVVSPLPSLNLISRDTSYCGLDSLKLIASGSGNFKWTPNIFINGANTATPTVFPNTITSYQVSLEQAGCIKKDTIKLTPLFDFTNSITADPASICEKDTLLLSGSSNHPSSWQWSPSLSVISANTRTTRAFPMVNTLYTLTSKWGKNCVATSNVNIPVKKLAVPRAGPDTAYCLGSTGVQLSASGGDSYKWSPSAGLSNININNPIATPLTNTKYTVAVGVTGCTRTVVDTILVLARKKPVLSMPNDTLICIIDTLKLTPSGVGSFSWLPNYNINSLSSSNPFVSPDVPTKYYVRMTDIYNCFKDDSVFVDVKADVDVFAGADTSICSGDRFNLSTTGNALTYTWTPTLGLNNTNIKNPAVNIDTTTIYTVVANIGKCEKSSSVKIKVAKYPDAQIQNVAPVCFGFSTQLIASGGSKYVWTPSTYLSNPNIANPQVINPLQNTRYIVSVTDTLGCIKAVTDTVTVKVIPPLNVRTIKDTTVVEGQPIKVQAYGASTYNWEPQRWLSSYDVAAPTALPEGNITYIVTGTDVNGCKGTDSVSFTVYKVDPDMYVPTAFTPDNDGLNDVIRPILLGMKSLNYFKIYNRFGQLVFSTTEVGKGWDGIFNGRPQPPSTFVWVAEGITFKGLVKQKKGTVILIR